MTGLPHLRLSEPHPGILAWYDGRVPGYRWSPEANWVDEGAMSVGVASYAVIGGDEAVVYDTHVSSAHGARIASDLAARNVRSVTVVYSHWHLDHVAGTSAFPGAEVIANVRTDAWLRSQCEDIEAGTLIGPPALSPLILPTRTFDGRLDLKVGGRKVQLLTFNIHSDDGTVLWLPDEGILLAGDTLEDPVTYVVEPQDFAAHLVDLRRLAELRPRAILPAHGDPGRIGSGGYGPGIIGAAERYTAWLITLRGRPDLRLPLREVIGADLASGTVQWEERYVEVHEENMDRAVRGER